MQISVFHRIQKEKPNKLVATCYSFSIRQLVMVTTIGIVVRGRFVKFEVKRRGKCRAFNSWRWHYFLAVLSMFTLKPQEVT